jgi:hypothetical protein
MQVILRKRRCPMRSRFRIAVLGLMLLILLLPVVAYANGGPCPDDPVGSKNCAQKAPPYYVVINRSFERLGPEYGTGCQPWILNNPDCKDCDTDDQGACFNATVEVEQTICGVEMPEAGAQDGDILIEMCCNCASDPNGAWKWRERTLQLRSTTAGDVWECPDPGEWQHGLPPGTGIDLPAPVIVGGFAIFGAVLLGAGVFLRRRNTSVA